MAIKPFKSIQWPGLPDIYTVPQIDPGLNTEGMAADAKVTGNAIAKIKADLGAYYDGEEVVAVEWESGGISSSTGADYDSDTIIRCGYIDLKDNFIKKIKTKESCVVQWYWYNDDYEFLLRASATIDGQFNISKQSYARYVRFAPITLDKTAVTIVKDSNVSVLKSDVERLTNAYNSSITEYVVGVEPGSLDSSTGEEVTNNVMVRTVDYINIPDSGVCGALTESNSSLNLIEYDSDKEFVRRQYFTGTGRINFSYHANTAYIRLSWRSSNTIKILRESAYADKTDLDVIYTGLASLSSIIKDMSEECIHHDNFSRTMTGYEIGKNSESDLTDNSYESLTGVSSDDGVRVDYGLTINADSSRSNAFTLRKIATAHKDNFMFECSTPAVGQSVYIAYKTKDANNFEAINIDVTQTYYNFLQYKVANGSYSKLIASYKEYYSTGTVIKLYVIGGIMSVYIDDKYITTFHVGEIDEYIYIGSYKNKTAYFDFVNLYNLIPPLVYNTEFLTDNNISTIPKSTLSANTGRYALDDTVTRFSNRSEHFMLYSTDEKINNGRRTERSLAALLPGNLRTMRYEFDVYFPSTILPDTATGSYADIFFQLHDRQAGVSRGAVPFHLAIVGNEIRLTQKYSSEQASATLTTVVTGYVIGQIAYDKWMHFDIFIKERYEENQHPFIEVKVDGDVVYQSRKPNCANDVNGTSAQYGEYKNNFDLITYSERYFDNFKVTY